MCVCVLLSYWTLWSVLLSSCPRVCMYLHWPSWTGCPVRWMLSTVSWASSNSHCTTNTGPGQNRGSSRGQTSNVAHTSVLMVCVGLVAVGTHFLMWDTLYIQRNSSTPPRREPVCSSLASVHPSTCSTTKHLSPCNHESIERVSVYLTWFLSLWPQ